MIAAALVLLGPGTPMLFQGEEWASSSPFQYFTDHPDEQLAQSVRDGRRREFAAFGWKPEDIPDPQAERTFLDSKLKWDQRTKEPHARVLAWHRALARLRRSIAGEVHVALPQRDVLVMRRGDIDVVVNLGVQQYMHPARELLLASNDDVIVKDGRARIAPETVAVIR